MKMVFTATNVIGYCKCDCMKIFCLLFYLKKNFEQNMYFK